MGELQGFLAPIPGTTTATDLRQATIIRVVTWAFCWDTTPADLASIIGELLVNLCAALYDNNIDRFPAVCIDLGFRKGLLLGHHSAADRASIFVEFPGFLCAALSDNNIVTFVAGCNNLGFREFHGSLRAALCDNNFDTFCDSLQ